MNHNLQDLKKGHPCFSSGPQHTGRIHLPVSGACNIGCRFCHRCLDTTEDRPGVCAELLSPVRALEVVRESLQRCPEIQVVGIAGPGDPLASEYAIETFRLVKEEFPWLFRCMSTNGLMLPGYAGALRSLGLHSLTVTVNSVCPQTLAKLNRFVLYRGRRYEGEEAAEILIANQLEGIRALKRTGTVIKVNTVLVPGINDQEIGTIAQAVKEAGASMYNLIPLIPQHELADIAPPDCGQLHQARMAAEQHIEVFRHCRHCRADAIGIPGGKDLHREIFGDLPAFAETFSHG